MLIQNMIQGTLIKKHEESSCQMLTFLDRLKCWEPKEGMLEIEADKVQFKDELERLVDDTKNYKDKFFLPLSIYANRAFPMGTN